MFWKQAEKRKLRLQHESAELVKLIVTMRKHLEEINRWERNCILEVTTFDIFNSLEKERKKGKKKKKAVFTKQPTRIFKILLRRVNFHSYK